jgi:hypothetical protein
MGALFKPVESPQHYGSARKSAFRYLGAGLDAACPFRARGCFLLWAAVFALSGGLVSLAQGEAGNWPKNLDAAVTEIVSNLAEKDKKTVRETPKKDLIKFHHGWGTGIRNSFGLWRGNEELLKSACGGSLCHPDNASMIIIEGVWEALHSETNEP